jgi:hypothetical protein
MIEFLFSRLMKRLLPLMEGNIDGSVLSRINSMVILVARLCLNHPSSQTTCCSPALITVLSKILSLNDTRFAKIQYSATDALKSLIKDSDTNSAKICTGSSSHLSLAEMLVMHLSQPSLPIGLFEEYLSCMQVIAVQKLSGGLLLKVD